MRKQFIFTATASWVTDGITTDLPNMVQKATATVKRGHGEKSCGGTLTVSASTKATLDEAVEYIVGHSLYGEHFKLKK
jgi:hypothetical protein